MLKVFYSYSQLNLTQLKQVYLQSITARMSELNRGRSEFESAILAEEEFVSFWRNDFFCEDGALCAVWEEEGKYLSVLRLQRYRDGLLLTGLETEPSNRNKGLASILLGEVLRYLAGHGETKVYSHIRKENVPSRKAHLSCGFELLRSGAVLLDGSASWNYDTYVIKI